MASFLGCFVPVACLRGDRIDHSESAGEGTRTGGGRRGRGEDSSRPVPQRELRVLEPPGCSLYPEGTNGFPGEHPFRVGLNGLDTIPQHKLRVRPMPPDPDPNSVVAQTGPQPERSRPGPNRLPIKNTRSDFSRQNPGSSLGGKRHQPGAQNSSDIH